VRVGRAAIDEQAMRLLEQHNPDVEFDWSRLLKETPPDPVRRDRDRDPRDRDRRERRESPRPPQRTRPLETTAAAVPPSQPPIVHERTAQAAEERAEAHADVALAEQAFDPGAEGVRPLREGSDSGLTPFSEPLEDLLDAAEQGGPVEPEDRLDSADESLAVAHREPLAADHAEYVEYAEASGHHHEPAQPREHPESSEPENYRTREPVEPENLRTAEPADSCPAAARLGADGVVRLRQRYTQIVARLLEKPMEDEARVELNARVERLNPDAWLTPDEVASALEQYESVFESLRSVVGHYPSRRRRR
jgi:hypothetical protein